MKKQLLLIAALIVGLTSSASPVSFFGKTGLHPETRPDIIATEITSVITPEKALKSRAESDNEVYYSLAGDPRQALAFQSQTPGMQIAMAFQIEPSFISSLTDGKITGISFYTGSQYGENINKIPKATVFITSALDGDFLYTQETTCPGTEFTKVDVTLDEPFSIPETGKVYVGVYFNVNSENNIPVVVDMTSHANNYGGWVAQRQSSRSKWQWDNIASSYGFMTLGATIAASNMPENSVSVVAIDGQPVAYENEPFGFTFMLTNNGVNSINKLTIEFGIEGEPASSDEFVLNRPLALNQSLIASIPEFVATKATKRSNVTVKVAEIDGQPNTSDKASGGYPVTIVPEGKGKQQNVVIEEFTSISCVFCPVGYTAMEQIHEDFTDGTIIPVCIHVNYPGRDPMTASSYNSVYSNYCTAGVPSSIINRAYDVYPYYDNLVETAQQLQALPAIVDVKAEATFDEETRNLTVTTKTSFSFDYTDGDQNFILAYGITEDNLGPYSQKNGYSGENTTVPGNWQDQPEAVNLIYNDVARQLDKYSGITGSIPAEITPDEEYEFSHTLTLLKAINAENIKIVVYVINRKTGEIANACSLRSIGNGNYTGIETVISEDPDAPVEYFNLQGIRVNNPDNGIYIRRQGNKVTKVLVR